MSRPIMLGVAAVLLFAFGVIAANTRVAQGWIPVTAYEADVNKDARVNSGDLGVVASKFNQVVPTATPVPQQPREAHIPIVSGYFLPLEWAPSPFTYPSWHVSIDGTRYPTGATFRLELQAALTPQQVLQILKDGHERARTGRRLTRDFSRQVRATAGGQHPLAVTLSCIDSRTPVEMIFDLGLGDILSIRIAGNITSREVLASAEYGCAVAGAKLMLVIGHTRCGAVSAAVKFLGARLTAAEATGCQHLDAIVNEIQQSAAGMTAQAASEPSSTAALTIVDAVARKNVLRVVKEIRQQSRTLDSLVHERRIAIVGAMYDVVTGGIEFLVEDGLEETGLQNTV